VRSRIDLCGRCSFIVPRARRKEEKERLGRLLSKVGEQDNKGGKQEDGNEGED
jgi:hypothetical protein